MTKKGSIFIFRAKKSIQCLWEGSDDVAPSPLPALARGELSSSQGLKTRRMSMLATPFRDAEGWSLQAHDAPLV